MLAVMPTSVFAQASLQEITYLLPAPGTLPAFGPWMIAQAKGYYKAEGLDVKFVSARGGVDVAKQVGAGNAVIGGAIGDTPIIIHRPRPCQQATQLAPTAAATDDIH